MYFCEVCGKHKANATGHANCSKVKQKTLKPKSTNRRPVSPRMIEYLTEKGK